MKFRRQPPPPKTTVTMVEAPCCYCPCQATGAVIWPDNILTPLCDHHINWVYLTEMEINAVIESA